MEKMVIKKAMKGQKEQKVTREGNVNNYNKDDINHNMNKWH